MISYPLLNIIILLLTFYYSVGSSSKYTIDIQILFQNNTGPQNRSRPVLTCYPALKDEVFQKCFVASGVYNDPSAIPTTFYNDVWRMDIDLKTKTVQWEQLPFVDPPLVSQGGYHSHWKKNLTAFSWTAGLNFFTFSPFAGICISDQIMTYDYQNLRYEVTTPINAVDYMNMSSAAFDRYDGVVYSFGGYNCSDFFQEPQLWTRYNIADNRIETPNPSGLSKVLKRDSATLNCIKQDKKCILGSGPLIEGGTTDEWVVYDIEQDQFLFPNFTNQPHDMEYISGDTADVWEIENGDFKVKHSGLLPMIGGSIANGQLLNANTVSYLSILDYNDYTFKNYSTGNLFTIKDEWLRNIPVFKTKEKNYCQTVNYQDEGCAQYINCPDTDRIKNCHYFIEFGGKELNEQVPSTYPNAVVLYTICRPFHF